jgi:hypothetical protein
MKPDSTKKKRSRISTAADVCYDVDSAPFGRPTLQALRTSLFALAENRSAYSPQEARNMQTYIHELPGWPQFRWDHEVIGVPLAAVRHHQGRLIGRITGLLP